MAHIYTNENFPQPVVNELRRLGHDVLTVLESGKAGIAEPDEAVLSYAANAGRILITLNRKHFIKLHNDARQHAGIIVCSYDPDFLGQAKRIHEAVISLNPTNGELVRINRP